MSMDRNDHVRELLGAYALDAVDDDERAAVEELVSIDAGAADEVARHRDTASYLAFTGATAPEGLWDRIALALEAAPPSPGPQLAKVLQPGERRHRWRRGWIGAVAAAAAVVIFVAGLLVAGGKSTPSTQAALDKAYAAASANPSSRHADLVSSDGTVHVSAAVDPSGRGYVSASSLPRLPDDRTYQLWGQTPDGRLVSLGLMGPRPGVSAFGAAPGLKALAVSNEAQGGSVQPTATPTVIRPLS